MIAALAHISAKQCRAHRLRFAMTVLAVALGVSACFAISTANRALLDSLSLTVQRLAGRSTLQVTAGESGFPEGLLDTVRSTPGIQLAEPVIEVVAQTGYADEGGLLILGIDGTGDQRLRQYEFDRSQTMIPDPMMYLAQPNSILLARTFAARHGLRIGDQLPVFTAEGKKNFVVQGFFQPQGVGSVFGGNIAVMDVYSAQVVFARGHNFDRIDLMSDPAISVDGLQSLLRSRLPAGVEIERPETRGKALENAVTAMRLGMQMSSILALIVAIYIILNSFTIAVDQRRKEIGILRSLGVSRGSIQRMFLGEAMIIGGIGSVAGIAAGYGLAATMSRVMGAVAAAVYGAVSTPVKPHFDPRLAVGALVLGIGVSLLGAWYPARSAARLDPIQALYNVEIQYRELEFDWRRLTLGLALMALCLFLVEFSPARVGAELQLDYGFLILVGMTVLLPLIVRSASRLIRPVMSLIGGPEGALAVDAMIRAPRRSSATIGALMVGLMFVYSTAAYIQSYQRTIVRWTSRMLNADLFVASSSLLRSTSYHFSEDLGKSIAALPGIKNVQDVRFTFIPFRGDIAAIVAIEMDGFLARASEAIEDGDLERARQVLPTGQGLLVSRNFAARWRCRVGQQLRIDSPSGVIDLPIVGIVEDYRSDKGAIFLDRALYKRYWNDNAVDFIDITLKSGQDATAVKREIQLMTAGTQHALVYTNTEFRRWIDSLIDSFFLISYMQLAVAVLVAAVGMTNTLIVSVAERRREFAIVRAVGGYRAQVRKMVLLEAIVIAIVGVVAGGLATVCNVRFLSHTVSTVLAGYEIPFYYPWLVVAISLPVVIVVALIAAWIPARHAMQLEVSEAIGYE
jgi:putative ABC transport system permease protein